MAEEDVQMTVETAAPVEELKEQSKEEDVNMVVEGEDREKMLKAAKQSKSQMSAELNSP